MGRDSKGYRKDGINGAGTGINVQGYGTVGATIWNQDMGGDQGDAQGPVGISLSGGATDHGDDDETKVRQRVGASSGRGGYGSRGDPPHRCVHQYAADKNSIEGGLPTCLCTVYGGGEDVGDKPGGALVGPRCDK